MDKNRKILIGVLAGAVALCLFVGIVGASFRMGAMMSGRQNTFAYGPRAVPQAVPPAAPQDDAPPVVPQTPRQQNGRGYYEDGPRFNRGWGGSPFGFIGGIFRFIGTLLLIGLVLFAIRALFFRRGWGGPGRWGWSSARGVPPFFEEWHKRAHEPQPAPEAPAADAPAANAPAADAPKPSEGDASGSATESKPDDKPQVI